MGARTSLLAFHHTIMLVVYGAEGQSDVDGTALEDEGEDGESGKLAASGACAHCTTARPHRGLCGGTGVPRLLYFRAEGQENSPSHEVWLLPGLAAGL